jgi:hypothetical protein
MGSEYEVYGWTFGDRLKIGKDEWHYAEVYRGQSLAAALWHAFRARRHYGCVKLEMR